LRQDPGDCKNEAALVRQGFKNFPTENWTLAKDSRVPKRAKIIGSGEIRKEGDLHKENGGRGLIIPGYLTTE